MKGVLWNGKYDVLPGARSRIDTSALAKTPLGGNNRLFVLGEMIGLLPPGLVTPINDPALALRYIHPFSEEARLALQLVFDPSPGSEIQGASDVRVVPVNPCTQATKTFTAYKLTGYLYGLPSNQVKAKQEAGTTGKKVSVDYAGNTETFDNLTKSSFSIQYTGAAAASLLSIDVSAANHVLTTANTGDVDNLNLDLNIYTTIQSLTDAINATGKYTAVILADKPGDSTMELDAVVGQAIKVAAYTAKSDLQAVIDGINARSGYVLAERIADATGVPANFDWTYLAGGANGATTNNDWQAALDNLKAVKGDFILALSSDASIHSMVDSHADYMLGAKNERQVFVGGALQVWNSVNARATAIAVLKAAAKVLNSDLTLHAGLGCYQYDPNGRRKLYPAYITAAMYAGIAAGGSPVLPLTAKYLRCLGLEVELTEQEAGDLVEAGVAVPIPDTVQGAGYQISRQVTTWNQDDDLTRIEFSVRRGTFYVAAQIRQRHDLLKGSPGTEGLDLSIISLTNSVLQMALREGYIRSFDPKKTVLRVDGMIRYVDYAAIPIYPVNWILSTYHVEPLEQVFSVGL
jgi:hypothetical protein